MILQGCIRVLSVTPVIFWRLKYEMRNYGTRNCGMITRVQMSFRKKKDYENKKSLSVEMGHSRNFKSRYFNIKEMRANSN